jgi:beta-carotene hydroxylase
MLCFMKPRFAKDYRALVWTLIFFPLVPALGITLPALAPWLVPVALYLAYCSGVLTHNHLHCPVFGGRKANAAYAVWLSVFYGMPIFSWIPTHNQNHHRYLNSEKDATHTYRYSRENDLFTALSYPLLSGRWHLPLLVRFVSDARRRSPRLFRWLIAQGVAVPLAHGAVLGVAVAHHGLATGLPAYALMLGLPALLAPYFMMFTNYVQHVHCDPSSHSDHSRNFVAPWVNWFVFDAGYHTAHHEHPGLHWSKLADAHRARASAIDPALNEHSILSFCLKNYVLGHVWPRLRTRDLSSAARVEPNETLTRHFAQNPTE